MHKGQPFAPRQMKQRSTHQVACGQNRWGLYPAQFGPERTIPNICISEHSYPCKSILGLSPSCPSKKNQYLDDPHVEAGLLCQLLADMPGGLGSGRKCCLEGLKLLGFDGRARPPSLRSQVLVVVLIAAHLLVGHIGTLRVLGVILARVLGIRGEAGVTASGGYQGRNRQTGAKRSSL